MNPIPVPRHHHRFVAVARYEINFLLTARPCLPSKYTKIVACISNKWPLPLSPQIKRLFTNSRLICDHLWVLVDAFRRRRSHYTAHTHKSDIHYREGKMESGGTPSPPLLMIVAMFVVLDHMRPGCSVLMALVFVMLAINKEWVDRWPLSPVIEGQISGRRWRNYGIVRHLEQSRPRGGP